MSYLFIPCPAEECLHKADNYTRYWYHAKPGCGSKTIFHLTDLFISCSGCNESGVLFDWMFKCSKHDFVRSSQQGWLYGFKVIA